VITWFQSLSPAHAAIALIGLFVAFCALYIAACAWRERVLRRRVQRSLKVNHDYKRAVRPEPRCVVRNLREPNSGAHQRTIH
jgi:hypothetical protein